MLKYHLKSVDVATNLEALSKKWQLEISQNVMNERINTGDLVMQNQVYTNTWTNVT